MAPGSRLVFPPVNIQGIQCPCDILDTEPDDWGDQFFVSKNGELMFSTTTNISRMISELDGDTTVWRRCFAPDARSEAAYFSLARLKQSAGVGWA